MESELAYKVIRINQIDNSIKVLGEFEYNEQGREDANMALYLDKCDEPSPDKGHVYTWIVCTVYKFCTEKFKEQK